MSATESLTLGKKERICSKLLIDRLFNENASLSMAAFPVRVVFRKMDREEHEPQDMMLVSVPKKHFKRAVKRNRVKRQIRESFRKNKQVLLDKLKDQPNCKIVIAFIWLDDKLHSSAVVDRKVSGLIHHVSEKI